MPGIVGVITKKPREWAERETAAMSKFLLDEPFYVKDNWSDEQLGVYVAWVSHPQSLSAKMPIQNQRKDVTIVLSGEEYGADGVCGQTNNSLERSGNNLRYLSQLYEGASDFPKSLNGMFHGIVADHRRGTVLLFNDRYGMHKLHYHQAPDVFYFACEAKAILAVRPELRAADERSFGELIALSCVLENRTLFKDIHVLPGASAWRFRNAALESKSTYFDTTEWENQTLLTADGYYEEMRSVLQSALPKYFQDTGRIGIALTGGFDTRVILALYPPVPRTLSTYTFVGPVRESNDARIGRRIAEACGQTHQSIVVNKEFLDHFADYAQQTVYLTEGTVDVNRAADLFVSKKAREIAPIKVVGTYGSEIVRHAVMFKPVEPPTGLFTAQVGNRVREAASTYWALRKQNPVTFAAFMQSPWYHHGVIAIEQSQLAVRSPYMDNEFVRTAYRAPTGQPSSEDDVRLRLIREASPALARVPSDRGININGGLFASMICHPYQEFTFKAEYAYDYGMPQRVAQIDRAFSWLHLEQLFLGRHKFLHYRIWYRDQLAGYVRELLLDPLTLSRPYLEKNVVEQIVQGHIRGDRNYTSTIHKLITLELVQRLFFKSN